MGNYIYKIGEYRLYKGEPLQSSENALLQTSLKVCAIFVVFLTGVWVGRSLCSNSCQEHFDHLSDLNHSDNLQESTNSSFSIMDGNITKAAFHSEGQSNSSSNFLLPALTSTAMGSSCSSSSSSENGLDEETNQINGNFSAEAMKKKNSKSFSTVSSASSATTPEVISENGFVMIGSRSQTSSNATTPRQPS